jgi:hypothetical protein
MTGSTLIREACARRIENRVGDGAIGSSRTGRSPLAAFG